MSSGEQCGVVYTTQVYILNYSIPHEHLPRYGVRMDRLLHKAHILYIIQLCSLSLANKDVRIEHVVLDYRRLMYRLLIHANISVSSVCH